MRSPNRPTDSAATWAPEHLGTFVAQVRDDRFFALWMLIATSGVRLEALTALRRHDVNLAEGRIRPSAAILGQRSAMTARRSYALDPTAYVVLKQHVATWAMERQVLRQETQRLFVWSNGEQVDPEAIHTMFRQHCSMAGLPAVSVQTIRQAYVVAAIDSGIPVRQISDRLRSNVKQSRRLVYPPRGEKPVVGGRSFTARYGEEDW